MSVKRFELADSYHKRGFNCCQSVLAAFSDLTGLSEQASFDIGGGFGGGHGGSFGGGGFGGGGGGGFRGGGAGR